MNLKQKFKLKPLKINSFFILAVGFYVRVRGGFAQIWCSDPFKPMVISGLRRNFGLRPPFPVLLSSFSVPRSPFPVLRPSFSVPRSLFIIFRFLFSVPRLHSSFSVPRSKFTVPCSSFLDHRCPFFVPRWSNILLLLWRKSGQFKQRFLKHLSTMGAFLMLRFNLDQKKS